MNKKELDKIAENSIYASGVAANTMIYCGEIFKKYMVPGTVLELGPAEGLMTNLLYVDQDSFSQWSHKARYTVVEGSHIFAVNIRKKYPMIDVYETMFESFSPKQKYDNIILGHVLEHVDDPVYILKLCKDWLNEGGRILVAVPNAKSLHRQAAVKMGMLKTIFDFSEKDIRHGHQRIFDMNHLTGCFEKAKLTIVKKGGYWLKPLSDGQIERDWTTDMVEAFLKLGEEYPDISGEIYVVAKK